MTSPPDLERVRNRRRVAEYRRRSREGSVLLRSFEVDTEMLDTLTDSGDLYHDARYHSASVADALQDFVRGHRESKD